MPSPRRFPPPWSVEERPACFIVRDKNDRRSAIFTSRTSRADVLLELTDDVIGDRVTLVLGQGLLETADDLARPAEREGKTVFEQANHQYPNSTLWRTYQLGGPEHRAVEWRASVNLSAQLYPTLSIIVSHWSLESR